MVGWFGTCWRAIVRKPGEAGGSPYATGGGGVLLEHEYVASVLGSLLLGQPVDGLGDEFLPTQVALQQEAFAPVDDVVIRGISPCGDRALLVACRRRPTLGRSSEATVALFADFLHVVIDKPAALASGELRLGLAVSGPFRPATELADLTEIARRQPDSTAFHAAVTTPGACSANVRRRLTWPGPSSSGGVWWRSLGKRLAAYRRTNWPLTPHHQHGLSGWGETPLGIFCEPRGPIDRLVSFQQRCVNGSRSEYTHWAERTRTVQYCRTTLAASQMWLPSPAVGWAEAGQCLGGGLSIIHRSKRRAHCEYRTDIGSRRERRVAAPSAAALVVAVVADASHHEPLPAIQRAADADRGALHLDGQQAMPRGDLIAGVNVPDRAVGTADQPVVHLGKPLTMTTAVPARMVEPVARAVVHDVGPRVRAGVAVEVDREPLLPRPYIPKFQRPQSVGAAHEHRGRNREPLAELGTARTDRHVVVLDQALGDHDVTEPHVLVGSVHLRYPGGDTDHDDDFDRRVTADHVRAAVRGGVGRGRTQQGERHGVVGLTRDTGQFAQRVLRRIGTDISVHRILQESQHRGVLHGKCGDQSDGRLHIDTDTLRSDALRLWALGTLAYLELHLLVLLQAAVARTLDLRVVHEHIRSAVIKLDEAVALLSTEPLDGAPCSTGLGL